MRFSYTFVRFIIAPPRVPLNYKDAQTTAPPVVTVHADVFLDVLK